MLPSKETLRERSNEANFDQQANNSLKGRQTY